VTGAEPVEDPETGSAKRHDRHWPKKSEWAEAREIEGHWRAVRVYDADDLVHWIEQTPDVGLWLATRLGKRPPGTRQLEELCEEWSLATQWPLTEDTFGLVQRSKFHLYLQLVDAGSIGFMV
jgi:hypothetical protein